MEKTNNIYTSFYKTSKLGELWSPAWQQLWPWSRSMSRSLHGANWKGLSQGSCIPNINALSLILQKIWARLMFLWRKDRQRDGQTNEWVLMSPTFAKSGGQIYTNSAILGQVTETWNVGLMEVKSPRNWKQPIFKSKTCIPLHRLELA